MSSRRFWVGVLVGNVSLVTLLYVSGWRIVQATSNSKEKTRKKKKNYLLEEEESDHDDRQDEEQGLRNSLAFKNMLMNSTANSNNFFLSDIVQKLWRSHIDIILSASIRESIEPLFATLPGPLATTRFTKFSLGSNPFKLENVVVVDANADMDIDADNGFGEDQDAASNQENLNILPCNNSQNNTSIKSRNNSFIEDTTWYCPSSDSSPKSTATSADVVKFYMDMSWEADCDIQLKADYVGTFGIQSLSIKAKLAFVLHPTAKPPRLPIVSAIEYAFVNPPEIDFEFSSSSSLGGLATKLAELKVVKTRMLPILQDTLASMVVLPYRMLHKMEDPSVPYWKVHHPPVRAIARITLLRGRGFQISNLLFGRKDVPDVHCSLSLGNKVWNSSTVDNSCEPDWNETSDFLWSDPQQVLTVTAYDRDENALGGGHYERLGTAHLTMEQALSSSLSASTGRRRRRRRRQMFDMELTDPQDRNRTTGEVVTLSIQLVSLTEDLSSLKKPKKEDSSNKTKSETNQQQQNMERDRISGLLEIMVLGAHNLPPSTRRSSSSSISTVPKEGAPSSTYVKVTCGKQEFYTGTVLDHSPDPVFDCFFLVPIDDQADAECDIVLTLYAAAAADSSSSQKLTILGTHTVTCDALQQAPHGTIIGQKEPIAGGGAEKVGDVMSLDFCVSIRGTQEDEEDDEEEERTYSSIRKRGAGSVHGGSTNSMSSSTNSMISSLKRTSNRSERIGKVRLTVVKGWGFKERKNRFRKKLDVPDVYCSVKLGSSLSAMWRTATIWDNPNPEWNESIEFLLFEDQDDLVKVNVYDDNEARPGAAAGPGNLIGKVCVPLADLLLSSGTPRAVDLAVKKKRNKGATVGFIALRAELID